MLQKLTIRNFKRFDDVEIELGDSVLSIGPNKRWTQRRGGKEAPTERTA